MANRRLMLAAFGVAVVLAMGGSAMAWSGERPMLLTFSGPVGLPGVTLGAGTYRFDVVGMGLEIVRVRSKDSLKQYFLGHTHRVNRPAGLPGDRAIAFGETPAGTPPRILIWYPTGILDGYQFIYKTR